MAHRPGPLLGRRRLDVDAALGLRLTLAAAAALLGGVCFTVLWLLVRSRWEPLADLDATSVRRLHEWAAETPGMVGFLKLVSLVFDPWAFRLATAVLFVWLLLRSRPRTAAWVAVTMVVGGVLSPLLKTVTGRARPVVDDPVATAAGLSFPSGHALNSVLGCGVLLLVLTPLLRSGAARRAAWLVAGLIVVLTGFSRVGLGVHFVSDVVGGWLVGLGCLAATAPAFETWRRKDLGRPPSPVTELDPELSSGGRRQD